MISGFFSAEIKKNIINYLLSLFKNLTLEKRGGSIFLMSGGLSLLEKSSSLWGSNLKLFNDHFKSRIDENSMNLYNNYKEDLIRELSVCLKINLNIHFI